MTQCEKCSFDAQFHLRMNHKNIMVCNIHTPHIEEKWGSINNLSFSARMEIITTAPWATHLITKETFVKNHKG